MKRPLFPSRALSVAEVARTSPSSVRESRRIAPLLVALAAISIAPSVVRASTLIGIVMGVMIVVSVVLRFIQES